MKNEKVLIDGLMKSYRDSISSIFAKFSKNGKAKVLEVAEPKRESGNSMFIEGLKEIGRPAMTSEIISRFKKSHPELKFSKNKKKTFRQQFYNSASVLSKEGIISRNLVGKSSYEYSLRAV